MRAWAIDPMASYQARRMSTPNELVKSIVGRSGAFAEPAGPEDLLRHASSLLLLLGHAAQRQAPDVNEALGAGVVELVALGVGGQAMVVQRILGATAHHHGGALEQLHLNLTGDELLGLVHEHVKRLLQRAEPQSVVA